MSPDINMSADLGKPPEDMSPAEEPQIDYSASVADLARSIRDDIQRDDEVWVVRKAAELSHRFAVAGDDRRRRMIADVPATTGDRRWDAFVAALAEWLAVRFDVPVPSWVHKDERYIHGGWWVTKLKSLRAWEYAGSPATFQNHGVYIHRESLVNI